MKVLYLNLAIPDHRVEKAAYLVKKAGHTCFYVGGIEQDYAPSPIYGDDLFKKYYKMEFSAKNILGMNLKSHINQLKRIRDEIDFDLIHANNVYCAHLADKIGSPMVFDDHEFYSVELKYMKSSIKNYKEYLSKIIMRIRYPKWERRLSKKYPVISVSNRILEDYKKKNPNVKTFLVPNAPLLEEINALPKLEKYKDELTSIYTGLNDFPTSVPYRNTTGLLEMWENNDFGKLIIVGDRNLKSTKNVKSLGFVSQKKLFEELLKSHVGLLGFLPHPYHFYCSLNKMFNYINCGLFIIYPKSMVLASEISKFIKKELDIEYGFAYENFSEVKRFLQQKSSELINFDYHKVMDFAKKHLVLDSFQKNIIDAYNEAIKSFN
ncbi:MAG: hypothetical protein ACTSR1_02070 [Candidatus Heimdallarchaeota archaeon]